jgi:hypothetical protein
LTSDWQRISFVHTAGASDTGVRFVFGATDETGTGDPSCLGKVLVRNAQAERVTYQTTPSTYVATTASAYYGDRLDFNPATLTARGRLVEPARTNSVLYSQTFSNVVWSVANASITANSIASPDGGTNGWKLLSTSSAGISQLYQSMTAPAAGTGTDTWILKAGNTNWASISFFDGASRLENWVNLSTGVAGTLAGGVTMSIESLGDGWYAVSATKVRAAAPAYVAIAVVDGNGSLSVTSGNYIYAFATQAELGDSASSYVPTGSSAVARSADSMSMTGTNFSSWFNQSEGTFIVEASAPRGGTGFGSAFGYYQDGSNRSGVQFFSGTSSRSYNFVASLVDVDLAFGSWTPSAFAKYAHAYKANDFAAVKNGGLVLTDTSATLFAAVALGIGSHVPPSEALNGWIKSIKYYRTRLPNAQLQSLTT